MEEYDFSCAAGMFICMVLIVLLLGLQPKLVKAGHRAVRILMVVVLLCLAPTTSASLLLV